MQNIPKNRPLWPNIGDRGTFEVKRTIAEGSVSGTFICHNNNFENAIIHQVKISPISEFMIGHTYSVTVIMADSASNQIICRLNNRFIGQKGKFIPSRMISPLVIEGKWKTDTKVFDNVELHTTSEQPFSDTMMLHETNAIVIDKSNDAFITVPLKDSFSAKNVQYPDFMDLIFTQNGTVKIQKLTVSGKGMVGPLRIQKRTYGMSTVQVSPSGIDKKDLIGKTLNVTVTGYDHSSERITCQFVSLAEAPLPVQQKSLLKAYAVKDLLRQNDPDMNLISTIVKKGNEYELCLKDDSPLISDRLNRFNIKHSESIRKTTDRITAYYSRIIEQYENKRNESHE